MNNRKKIICMGMAVADILVRGIEFQQGIQGDVSGEEISLCTGGDALNQSIVLARLGYQVTLMSLVGKDDLGQFLREKCRAYGVDASQVAVSSRYPTSASVVCVRQDGERSFISIPHGTVNEYGLEDIDLEAVTEEVKILSVGSLGASRRLDGSSLAKVFEKAKRAQVEIIADMVGNLGEDTNKILREAFPYIDYLIPSREEVQAFTGETNPGKGAAVYHGMGVENVIIKSGKQGAFISTPEGQEWIPAMNVKAVDTTGAGDSFVGGFAAARMEGMDTRRAVQFATGTAAASVQKVGAARGVENREQILEIMDKMW